MPTVSPSTSKTRTAMSTRGSASSRETSSPLSTGQSTIPTRSRGQVNSEEINWSPLSTPPYRCRLRIRSTSPTTAVKTICAYRI
ncbi:unnamed protein product [Nippostrongylus brasiliensis]|uniref:Uncharacterized protein n=1 Tax=Nippostrongylus brasiliensis TaxID=27835 RepID=A0A0N4YWR4_NIPBR|nr:unnamed protein product [Nippostrongylus brasiliensis]